MVLFSESKYFLSLRGASLIFFYKNNIFKAWSAFRIFCSVKLLHQKPHIYFSDLKKLTFFKNIHLTKCLKICIVPLVDFSTLKMQFMKNIEESFSRQNLKSLHVYLHNEAYGIIILTFIGWQVFSPRIQAVCRLWLFWRVHSSLRTIMCSSGRLHVWGSLLIRFGAL